MPTPYLFFNGTCAEAFAAYADIFGGTITQIMRADAMPGDYTPPEGREGWIMHASLDACGGSIFGSDDLSGGAEPMAGATISMTLPSLEAARTAFDRLADGGEVRMAFEPTFWTPGFGTLTDRWGTRWMIQAPEAEAT